MDQTNIIKNCARCGKKNNINVLSGLCASCEQEILNKLKELKENGNRSKTNTREQ